MSTATTTVYLYIGLDNERRRDGGKWPKTDTCGHIELVSWIEGFAVILNELYESEFANLDLTCVFDYEVTEALGAWLYHNDGGGFVDEARRLVALERFSDLLGGVL